MEELYDKILDFIEDHRILCIVGAIAFIVIVLAFVVRGVNVSRGKALEQQLLLEQQAKEELEAEALASMATPEPVEEEPPKSQYEVNLGLNAVTDGRVEYQEATPEPVQEVDAPKKATYDITVRIFDSTGVPKVNVDGSSCADYLAGVSLDDFGTKWGTSLTEDDKNSTNRVLVGVEQEQGYAERGDLQSVGWLIQNLSSLSEETAIKFTNLHVIGSLSATHTAVLCSYDWYSVFGLKDTLVMFEDISGTLDASAFTDGAVFSATVFAHNVKVVENVNGQRVVCVQYSTF